MDSSASTISASPRLLDSDDEPTSPSITDPRFSLSSLTLEPTGYSDQEYEDDGPPFAATPDPGASRRRRRARESMGLIENAEDFSYSPIADGNTFRLAVLQPGTGTSPIECQLVSDDVRQPQRAYKCLSYAWESVNREAAIMLDGFRFLVTKNLLKALQSLRKPRTPVLIWIDQVCINQEDLDERARQVSIMKHIFNQAHKIYVWLGEGDTQTEKLFAAAKRVALSRYTTVVCGLSYMTWDALVRLIRDVRPRSTCGFNKQVSLLGNPRQRVAIITQMISSQKEGLAHTDITQLLILGKSSKATDSRDKIYAFYGITHLRTFPDYSTTLERLFVDIVHMYISSVQWEASYESWHDLTPKRKAFQLMSILYTPIWCNATPHFVTGSGKDEWTTGIRTEHRAGGSNLEDFEVKESSGGMHRLRISALIVDTIVLTNEMIPAPTSGSSQELSSSPIQSSGRMSELPTLRFGRHFFTTAKGYTGLATPGISTGDEVGILLGGDVPVIMRPRPEDDTKRRAYQLLCECYVQSHAVMSGELLRTSRALAEGIAFV
ncbi:Hypothetical predicted protein [Lecanosticta acicola]|uniref:Heterokaryon incompatibility domain-containing protein n=1 Tax=Lecanosticta acicola TaxID=111012 RepID=A0AAI8Z9A2_9PEZI|nr:Hypothetical predicted protein [Lecanosticta acicola]